MEDEILKHSMKVYHEVKNKQHSFGKKVKEIIIEILIIVFAVTLSIWLHGWDERNSEHKEAKDFLSDLKDDLGEDIESITAARDSLVAQNALYYSFLSTSEDFVKNKNKTHPTVHFGTGITTTKINNGDYEGFKSSGKVGYIEDKNLKKSILKYYQETTPSMLELEKATTSQMLKIMDYIIDNKAANTNLFDDEKLRLFVKFYLDESENVKNEYDDAISQAKQIVDEINKTK